MTINKEILNEKIHNNKTENNNFLLVQIKKQEQKKIDNKT